MATKKTARSLSPAQKKAKAKADEMLRHAKQHGNMLALEETDDVNVVETGPVYPVAHKTRRRAPTFTYHQQVSVEESRGENKSLSVWVRSVNCPRNAKTLQKLVQE